MGTNVGITGGQIKGMCYNENQLKDSGKIGKGTLYILFGKILVLFLGILNVTLVPKILGPTNMGFYSYWLAVMMILLATLNLGGALILTRYLPELRKTNPNSIRPLIKKIIEIKFPFILIMFIGGLFFFPNKYYFIIVLIASLFSSFNSIIAKILYAYNDMKKYSFVQFSRILTRLILVVIFFIIIGHIGILYGLLGGAMLITFIFGAFAIDLLPEKSGSLERPMKEYLSFGLFVYLGTLFFILTIWSVVILSKNYITDMAVIGFLGLGLQICLVAVIGVVSSVGEGVLPSMVEFHVTNYDKLKRSLELSWKYTNLVLFPTIFGLFILASPAICIVVGEEFLPTVEIIELFLPATVFIAWTQIHKQILLVYEKKKEIFLTQLIGFMVFLISGLVLIKNIGIIGAPISLSLGTFAGFIGTYFLSSKIMKIHSYLRYIIKPFIASIGMCVILSFIEVTNPTYLVGATVLGGGVYLIMMLLMKGITRTDIERVKEVFK